MSAKESKALKVLVVDDEPAVCRFFEEFLGTEKGLAVASAVTGKRARELAAAEPFALAFVDLKLPDDNGIELLSFLRKTAPECKVVIMTGHSTARTAVEAIRLGAYDYVEKPFDELVELERIVNGALASFQESGAKDGKDGPNPESFNIVCGPESPLQEVLTVADKIAKKNLTVLIYGPTGAGKEVLARFIHLNSQRAEKPFISVNCGAFSESLLESELFGHEKGAFTGAAATRRGIFEIANGGTLFLDEIGEATPAIQVKLLRTLETGEFMRVGGERHHKTDVRIIAATNVDLSQAVERNLFRRDLYYRLDVVSLEIPPLKERIGDFDALIRHFIDKALPEGERGRVSFTPRAKAALLNYDWPGNVREMANVVARAVALREGDLLDTDTLPAKLSEKPLSPAAAKPQKGWPDSEAFGHLLHQKYLSTGGEKSFQNLMNALKAWEDEAVSTALARAVERSGGRQIAAARLLGVSDRVVRYYLRERRK